MLENQMLKNKIEAYKQVLKNHNINHEYENNNLPNCNKNLNNTKSINLLGTYNTHELRNQQVFSNAVWSNRTNENSIEDTFKSAKSQTSKKLSTQHSQQSLPTSMVKKDLQEF